MDSTVTVLDFFVLLSAIVSTVLCSRSLAGSFRLQRLASKFFLETYEYRLKWRDSLPLYNRWFVGVILSNVLAMLGSLMKIILSYKVCVLKLTGVYMHVVCMHVHVHFFTHCFIFLTFVTLL